MTELDRDWRLLVGGRTTTAARGGLYPTHSPSTGELLAEVPAADADDVDASVKAGLQGQAEWTMVPPRERAGVLRSMAAVLLDNRDELSLLDALDSGNPVTAMLDDVDRAAAMLNLFADWADRLGGDTHDTGRDHLHYTLRAPYGVVARIVPYNHPIMFAASKLAAPLLAGNAVILKAPDQAPLSALRMGELFSGLLPAGALNVLSGIGSTVGQAIVAHPQIRRVAFTGSVATGQSVLQTAAATGIKNVTLELGGKNPMVVFADADVRAAGEGAIVGMNFAWTAGQSCGSTSRLLVHRSLMDDVVDRLQAGIRTLRMGDPLDPDTEMGTMVTREHQAKVNDYIERGRADGLRMVRGGQDFDPRGAFVEPTVFVDVPPQSPLWREEIFGPVLVVTPFDDEQEAVQMVNDTDFGLTASFWTRDIGRAHHLAASAEAGYVWVNTASQHFVGLPFGGIKDSGIGREESIDELRSFTQTKAVTVRLGPAEEESPQ